MHENHMTVMTLILHLRGNEERHILPNKLHGDLYYRARVTAAGWVFPVVLISLSATCYYHLVLNRGTL